MDKEEKTQEAHCLVVCYPSQGHINPMLQFSKRLENKGVRVRLVTTRFIFKSIMYTAISSTYIPLETISDGYDEGGIDEAESIGTYLETFSKVGSQTLTRLIEKLSGSGDPVDCIIYDAFLAWCLDVAKKCGLLGATFFTQSCAVGSIYYHAQQGLIKVPLEETEILVPGLPPLQPQDFPSFLYRFGSYPAILTMLLDQFSNIEKADWVLCNTIYELEPEVVDWMAKLWPVRTIGPTIPSMYLDKRLEDDVDYGFSIFKPNNDACTKWLDEKPEGSVVYVSFGSLAVLDSEQMVELCWALKGSNYYFLWVVRSSEEAKLPTEFIAETKEKGLVVSWCPQLEILAHKAIACFITHCGWNSTLEALCLGVPMVVMPHWSDQGTNAKCITDVWKVGLKASQEKGIVEQEAIKRCVREVMESEEMKVNPKKWSKLGREAMSEGGSSDRNISEFVDSLVHRRSRVSDTNVCDNVLRCNKHGGQ
ncbi:hypothetical protein K2173_000582 [Erythroxylum novogranatense]|uniref:Glycosyltransferase n=1 Tax=Erythroxylum novogranatense TaxID=1862640 RepID=A0AAV8S7W4_9ROSI|nr:hypothetical protein K2173_000582 [Erythroxylum novogranatense]